MLAIKIQELHPQKNSLPVKLFLLNHLGTSTHPGCRQLLREKLVHCLENAGYTATPDLLDLDKLPVHDLLNISLSHGSHHSLIGWIEKSYRLGVDIEILDRLSLKIIERVSSPIEIANAPQSSYLWSAKEAAFKALFPLFKVVGSVKIIDWVPLKSQRWTFSVELKNNSDAYGELCLIEGHSVAFFTLPS